MTNRYHHLAVAVALEGVDARLHHARILSDQRARGVNNHHSEASSCVGASINLAGAVKAAMITCDILAVIVCKAFLNL